jgi:hypothetical protein
VNRLDTSDQAPTRRFPHPPARAIMPRHMATFGVPIFALRRGGPKVLAVRTLDEGKDQHRVALSCAGESLGEHQVRLDEAPVTLLLAEGTLEVALVTAFNKPFLSLRLDGAALPGSAFDVEHHRAVAQKHTLRALLAMAACLGFFLFVGRHLDALLVWSALVVGLVVTSLDRDVTKRGIAVLLCCGALSLVALVDTLFASVGGEGLLMLLGMATYDLLFLFGEHEWVALLKRP